MDDTNIPQSPDPGDDAEVLASLARAEGSQELAPSASAARPLDATLLRQLEKDRDEAVSPRKVLQLLRRRRWLLVHRRQSMRELDPRSLRDHRVLQLPR